MLEQFAAFMRSLSRGENEGRFRPRPGQSALIEWLLDHVEEAHKLCIQWPGGYGKTVAIALTYWILREHGRVNRLFVTVANDQQRIQFRRGFVRVCKILGLKIAGDCVWDFGKGGRAIRMSNEGRCEVFVATIHAVSATNKKATDTLLDLVSDGHKWMLAADEYHHYAQEKDWGLSLQRVCNVVEFSLAMSATPTRDGNATIFGEPHLKVTYLQAVAEGAVKRMFLRRYHYTVTAKMADGTEVEYTTDEIREAASGGTIDSFEEKVGLRYSTKYIHPMVLEPLLRLQNRRTASGLPLQMLVRAMSCRHAAYLCKVIREIAPGLNVDWVGSGESHGRPDDVNSSVIEKFVPLPDKKGEVPLPSLDVLVQVAKVGEGSDSVLVAEIVDLALANIDGAANQTKQVYYRGSRIIPGLHESEQYCNVNVPSDAKIAGLNRDAGYEGVSLMQWLDGESSRDSSSEDERPPRDVDFVPVPDDFLSSVVRRDAELTEVTDDMRGHFKMWVDNMNGSTAVVSSWDIENNPEHMEIAKRAYLVVFNEHARELDLQAMIEKRQGDFESEVGRLAAAGAKRVEAETGEPVSGKLIGRIAKKINTILKKAIGRPRDEWLDEDFTKAGKILHAWGCAIRDKVEGRGVLPWLD